MNNILHIVDQSGQPYGSARRCCNECGLSIYAFGDDDKYVISADEYTKEIAEKNKATRCCDLLDR